MTKYRLVIAGLSLCIIAISCGKVTQNTTVTKDNPSFNINFSVPVVATENIQSLSNQVVTPSIRSGLDFHSNIYVSVKGVSLKGARKELSWGKGVIHKRKVVTNKSNQSTTRYQGPPRDSLRYQHRYFSTSNQTAMPSTANQMAQTTETKWVYTSKAYDKRGVEIKGASSYTWAKPQFQQAKVNWNVQAQKIRKSYHRFLVVAYSDMQLFRFTWIDHYTVSKNNTVSLGEISDYDTFIAILEMIQMEEENDFDHKAHQLLIKLVDHKVYDALNTNFPRNISPVVGFEKASFRFEETPVLKAILTLFDYSRIDLEAAKTYLDKVKKEVLSDEAKRLLKSNFSHFKRST